MRIGFRLFPIIALLALVVGCSQASVSPANLDAESSQKAEPSATTMEASEEAATTPVISESLTVDAMFYTLPDQCPLHYPESGFTPGSEIIQETKCARSQLRWPVGMVPTDEQIVNEFTGLVPSDSSVWMTADYEAGWGLERMISMDACAWSHIWLDGFEQSNQVMMDAASLWFHTDFPGYVDQFPDYDLRGHDYDIGVNLTIHYIETGDYNSLNQLTNCPVPGGEPAATVMSSATHLVDPAHLTLSDRRAA